MFYVLDKDTKEDVFERPFTTRQNAMDCIYEHFTALGYPKDWFVPKIDKIFIIQYVVDIHYTKYLNTLVD